MSRIWFYLKALSVPRGQKKTALNTYFGKSVSHACTSCERLTVIYLDEFALLPWH